jgi:hypothetical protein
MHREQVSLRARAACVAFFAAMGGCGESRRMPAGPVQPDDRVAKRFGDEALAVIADPLSADAYRIGGGGSASKEERAGETRLGRFNTLSAPIRLEKDWLARMRGILFDSASYEWEKRKLCRPTPGVAVRYRQGDKEFHLYLCFECDMLQIGRPGAERWADFDPARPLLVRLVKELLPWDNVIQELQETH